MYYNSNNNDYYNSYKKEIAKLRMDKKEERTQKIIKFILFFLTLGLLIAAAFYLYKYFNPTLNNPSSSLPQEKTLATNKPTPMIIIREEELPKSIQLAESNIPRNNQVNKSKMNERDIELIVKIIMAQMNEKIEKPLEEQLQEINNKIFVKKSLKEENHYNKIVLNKNEVIEVKNASLMKLSSNLNNIINEEINSNSNYTEEITKEVIYRKNEMRIIIVQEGDTLSRIAKKAYGEHSDYRKIFAANPEIIKNPNQIFVGQRLRIPS